MNRKEAIEMIDEDFEMFVAGQFDVETLRSRVREVINTFLTELEIDAKEIIAILEGRQHD